MAANLEDQLIDKVRLCHRTSTWKRYDSWILLSRGLALKTQV